MPSNQRINERKARQRKNEQKLQRIIWGIIILVASVLIVMKVLELDVSSIKNKYFTSDGKLNVSVTTQDEVYPYNLDSSKDVKVICTNDRLAVMTGVSLTVLNPTDASVLYGFNHGYGNPIMTSSGSYTCIIDQGSNRFRLDKLNKAVYETNTDNAILTAAVSKGGNVIYATKSNENKSSLFVINDKLKKLMTLEINTGYVVSVAIDDSGKHCAYAVVNSKDAKLTTTLYTINIGDKHERAHFDFTSTNLLDMHYCSDDFYAIFDDGVYSVTNQKKLHEIHKQGKANTVCYNYTKDGELIYVYSKYASAAENSLNYITPSGKIKTKIDLKQKPKFVSSATNEICVLFTDKINVYSLTKGELKGSYSCGDSVTSVNKLSTKLFVSTHQQIDVIEGKQK